MDSNNNKENPVLFDGFSFKIIQKGNLIRQRANIVGSDLYIVKANLEVWDKRNLSSTSCLADLFLSPAPYLGIDNIMFHEDKLFSIPKLYSLGGGPFLKDRTLEWRGNSLLTFVINKKNVIRVKVRKKDAQETEVSFGLFYKALTGKNVPNDLKGEEGIYSLWDTNLEKFTSVEDACKLVYQKVFRKPVRSDLEGKYSSIIQKRMSFFRLDDFGKKRTKYYLQEYLKGYGDLSKIEISEYFDVDSVYSLLPVFIDHFEGRVPEDDLCYHRNLKTLSDYENDAVTRIAEDICMECESRRSDVPNLPAITAAKYKFNKYSLLKFLTSPGEEEKAKAEYIQGASSLSFLALKSKVVLDLPDLKHAGDSLRNLSLANYRRMDPILSPESIKIGLITYLTDSVRIDSKFKTLKVKMVNAKTKDVEWLDPIDERGKYIAFDPPKDWGVLVNVRKDGKVLSVSADKVDYYDFDLNIMGESIRFSPFFSNNAGKRNNMAGNMLIQANRSIRGERPTVGTKINTSHMCIHGKDIFNRIEKDLTVKFDYANSKFRVINSKTERGVTTLKLACDLAQESGKLQLDYFFEVPTFTLVGSLISFRVNVLTSYDEDSLVLSPIDLNSFGEVAIGKNLTVAYMPYYGWGFEDGLVFSSEVYEQGYLDSNLVEKEVITLLGEDLKYQLKTKVGDVVYSGDEVASFSSRGIEKTNIGKKKLKGPGGTVFNVRTSREEGKRFDTVKIEIFYLKFVSIQVGDKFANRHGNKGVCVRILPKEMMPTREDGSRVHVLLNPLSVPARINMGQVLEALFSKAGNVTIPDFMQVSLQELHSRGISSLGEILWNPETGLPYNNLILCGEVYYYKLHHTAPKKMNTNSIESLSLSTATLQARRGAQRNGGQKYGEMDIWSFLGFGMKDALQEIFTLRSTDHIARELAVSYMEDTGELPSIEKLGCKDYMRYWTQQHLAMLGVGLKFDKDDKSYGVALLSDNDKISNSLEKFSKDTYIRQGKEGVKSLIKNRRLGLYLETSRIPNPFFLGLILKAIPCKCSKPEIRRTATEQAIFSNTLKFVPNLGKGYFELVKASTLGEALKSLEEAFNFMIDLMRRYDRGDDLSVSESLFLDTEEGNMTPGSFKALRKLAITWKNPENLFSKFWNIPHYNMLVSPEDGSDDLIKELIKSSNMASDVEDYYSSFKTIQKIQTLTRDMLKNKKTGFRGVVLSRRVYGSFRGVIVGNPNLPFNRVGVSEYMMVPALKPLYRGILKKYINNHYPGKDLTRRDLNRILDCFLSRDEEAIVDFGVSLTIDKVRDILNEGTDGYLISFTRHPVLHKYNTGSFYFWLVPHKSIEVPSLVNSAYNADFDGDTSKGDFYFTVESQEDLKKGLFHHGIVNPKDSSIVCTLSQDMVLGLFLMTREFNDGHINTIAPSFLWKGRSKEEILNEVKIGRILFNDRLGDTTVGRYLLKEYSKDFPFMGNLIKDMTYDKGSLKKLFQDIYDTGANNLDIMWSYEMFKTLGYLASTYDTISVKPIPIAFELGDNRDKIVSNYLGDGGEYNRQIQDFKDEYEEVNELKIYGYRCLFYDQSSKIYSEGLKSASNALLKKLPKDEDISVIIRSGAKGDASQIRQSLLEIGAIADCEGNELPFPITGNYSKGLLAPEMYFTSFGTRMGLKASSVDTAEAGALTRTLVYFLTEIKVVMDDCGSNGVELTPHLRNKFRGLLKDLLIGKWCEEIGDYLLDFEVEKILEDKENTYHVRFPHSCNHEKHICRKCYGISLEDQRCYYQEEKNISYLTAQCIGEPTTQLNMRIFHKGGIASAEAAVNKGVSVFESLLKGNGVANTKRALESYPDVDYGNIDSLYFSYIDQLFGVYKAYDIFINSTHMSTVCKAFRYNYKYTKDMKLINRKSIGENRSIFDLTYRDLYLSIERSIDVVRDKGEGLYGRLFLCQKPEGPLTDLFTPSNPEGKQKIERMALEKESSVLEQEILDSQTFSFTEKEDEVAKPARRRRKGK